VAEGEEIAARYWAVEGQVTKLPAEVDENFHLLSSQGEFLLKVVPADESAELTDLVTRALVHVERQGKGTTVQRVVPTSAGDLQATFKDGAGEKRRARLTTFLPGQMLRSVAVDREMRELLGTVLARLALALRDFDHPAADRDLSWDLRHAGRMAAMLDELPESRRRSELRASLTSFEEQTVPRLTRLPAQIVHNDLSRDNAVLGADGSIAVIDFGDVVRTQRINDVAVAMADHLDEGPEPFAPALDVLRGYLAVEPLGADEVGLLYELVRIREVTRVVGGEWRAARFPENRAYLGRNVERLTAVLDHLPRQPSAADAERLAALGAEAGR
jgi:hydroxylysine kinase